MSDFEDVTSVSGEAALSQEQSADQPAREEPSGPDSPYASSPFVGYYETHTAPQAPTEKKSRPSHARKSFPKAGVSLLSAACLAVGIAIGASSAAGSKKQAAALSARVTALESQLAKLERPAAQVFTPLPAGETLTPAQVYAQNVDSVVGIRCASTAQIGGQSIQGMVSGSGFILSEDGYIVTNYHVVEGGTDISVITQDKTSYPATLVGQDTTADMALLKIEVENLQSVTLGSSESLAIGDMVVAIGNPLSELEATQTVGYISGKNREVSTDNNVVNMLQTDAAINSGNSGGPLFNMCGEVVGITTAKYSGTSSSGASIEGLSFAIPIDEIKSGIEDLRTQGYIRSAYLGIRGMDVEEAAVEVYGLPKGVYVASVEPDGAAKAAGVQPKDIITALGDTPVTGFHSLARALRLFSAGDETTVTVYRGGQTLVLDITLAERPRQTEDASASSSSGGEIGPEWFDYFNRFFENFP